MVTFVCLISNVTYQVSGSGYNMQMVFRCVKQVIVEVEEKYLVA